MECLTIVGLTFTGDTHKKTLISMHTLNIVALLHPDVKSVFLVSFFVYTALYL